MKAGKRRWLDPDTVEVESKSGSVTVYKKRWATSFLSLRHYSMSSHFVPNLVENRLEFEEPRKLKALKEKARRGELDYDELSGADNELIRFHHLQEVKPEKGSKRIRRTLSGWAALSGPWPDHRIVACSFDGEERDQDYKRAWVTLTSTDGLDKTIGSVLVSERNWRDADPEHPDSEDDWCLVFEAHVGADVMNEVAKDIRAAAKPPVVHVTFKSLLLSEEDDIDASNFAFDRDSNVYCTVTGIGFATFENYETKDDTQVSHCT
ncbi:hypothetical protein NKH74_27730 [Mesorhizobium sp. M0933]|uniref:hypothetical protein n=1 Tax=Mesorhizobium sp. M0933 TaxID=2957030 RepID=UPI003339C2CE